MRKTGGMTEEAEISSRACTNVMSVILFVIEYKKIEPLLCTAAVVNVCLTCVVGMKNLEVGK